VVSAVVARATSVDVAALRLAVTATRELLRLCSAVVLRATSAVIRVDRADSAAAALVASLITAAVKVAFTAPSNEFLKRACEAAKLRAASAARHKCASRLGCDGLAQAAVRSEQ